MSDLEQFECVNDHYRDNLDGNLNRASSYGMNSDPDVDGAIGESPAERDSDLEIIDIDSIDVLKDEETWLVAFSNANALGSQRTVDDWISGNIEPGETALNSKKSLVNKLDIISKGSPTRFSSSSSSYGGPSPASYLSRQNLSSTPLSKPVGARSQFDSRTFSRATGNRALINRTFGLGDDMTGMSDMLDSSPIKFNHSSATFLKLQSPQINTTFDKESSPSIRLNETFDQKSYFRLASPRVLNSTFDKESPPPNFNSTFRKDESPFNATFRKDDGSGSGNGTFDIRNATFDLKNATSNATFEVKNSSGNATFEVKNSSGNATFDARNPAGSATFDGRKLSEDRLSSTSSNSNVDHYRLSRDSSHDLLDEDRLSTTSESSVSHRLNDVGDVQNIARMQEESLRQPILPLNHRSATISPSSEHSANSPSTEGYMTGNNLGYQSEEGGDKAAMSGHHYSSQDSLPDSPYSSQSLDVQPLSEQDRLRRSMPNLNKIRGQNGRGGGMAGPGIPMGRGPGLGGPAHRPTYGALSRQHNSDPRLQAGAQRLRFQAPAPSRGTVITSSNEFQYSVGGGRPGLPQPRQYGLSTLQPPSSSQAWAQPAQPPKTGIPRPGSRIPGPRTVSGIPKPGGGYSQPGSRASSTGPRKMSADNYY